LLPDLPAGTILARGFDWQAVAFPPQRIEPFVDLKYGKALQEARRRHGQVPVYGTNGRCGWHDSSLSDGPGVILGRKGQGHLGVEWCPGRFWVIDTAYYAAVDERRIDLKWFYYITRYVGLDDLKTGEKPGLQREVFRAQAFPLPSLSEQRAIGVFLGILDYKIELNRRMNRTLEEMASALFRSWFVDFDPVVAKAAGRAPFGMDPTTAALFPSQFENSEFGQIPRSWQVGRLGDLIQLKRGYDLPNAHRRPGEVPIVSSSGPSGTHSEARIRGPGVVTGRYGTIGQVFYVREDFWPLNTTLYVHDFKGTAVSYAYHLLRLVDFHKFSDKAAVPGINRNHVHNEGIVVPPRELQNRFGRIGDHLLHVSVQNDIEVRTLMLLRDTLLPKLLSGEIRLRDAERAVEAVA
jgi:type I restriction enzyme S subunit